MSRPIEATPILSGKDAERFIEEFDKVKITQEHLTYLEKCAIMYEKFYKKLDNNRNNNMPINE